MEWSGIERRNHINKNIMCFNPSFLMEWSGIIISDIVPTMANCFNPSFLMEWSGIFNPANRAQCKRWFQS